MRLCLLAILPFTLFPALADAGVACIDACTSVGGGANCLSFGSLGCRIFPGQTTGQCTICQADQDCSPGGNCDNGLCINVICGLDAGVDAGPGDAMSADVDLDASPGDVDPNVDAAPAPDLGTPDSGPADMGVVPDTGPRDTGTIIGGVGKNDPRPMITPKEEGCDCTTGQSGGAGLWLFAIAALGVGRLRR
ncbi:MAG: hypothetical protein IPG45_27710 [Deltaproteobacteria bacterium]|jgi:MYXO-CTERM domain-containing protein|nr:hypothetical protein [Deltaproteobacteria bacterium]